MESIEVPIGKHSCIVLHFRPDILERHRTAAREHGVSVETYLAEKLAACGVADGPVRSRPPRRPLGERQPVACPGGW